MKKVIFILTVLIVFQNLAYAKTISVIYDDSGSMKKNNKWIYANYAFQNFIGFLSDSDSLYVTKMSDFEKENDSDKIESKKINLNDRNTYISYFRKNVNYKSMRTPYIALEKAMGNIDKSKNKDENWLLVILDGEFEDARKFNKDEKETLSKKIDAFWIGYNK